MNGSTKQSTKAKASPPYEVWQKAMRPVELLGPTYRITEAFDRLRSGRVKPGDLFGIRRNLVKLFRDASPADLARTMIALGRFDDGAVDEIQLSLTARRPTKTMRAVGSSDPRFKRRSLTRALRERLFQRVLDHWRLTGDTLETTFDVVSQCEDAGALSAPYEGMTHASPDNVRLAYKKCRKEAERLGHFMRTTGSDPMAVSAGQWVEVGELPKPGRPKQG